ncbi:MAG: S8 family serine peptidase, partial [Cytophagales bacterium]|nr:S8 family serine peptidase [Cytophagales bacterium]
AERADSLGVDIINSSLGYREFEDSTMDYDYEDLDGKTALSTLAAKWASERGILVVSSAGNSGDRSYPWDKIVAPGDAREVITVGGVHGDGLRIEFSSKGPNFDGQLKPNVMAPAKEVLTIRPDGSFGVSDGTSFSTPLISSLLAGLKQYYPMKTSKELKTILYESADHYDAPDSLLGYGVPHFLKATQGYPPEKHPSLHVFPNPVYQDKLSYGIVYVEYMYTSLSPDIKLIILDSEGKIRRRQTEMRILGKLFIISMKGLPKGIYFIRQFSERDRKYAPDSLKLIYQ